METILTQKDLENNSRKVILCIGVDFRMNEYYLNITTSEEIFSCPLLFAPENLIIKPFIGGELTMENIKALHTFLTDLLRFYD